MREAKKYVVGFTQVSLTDVANNVHYREAGVSSTACRAIGQKRTRRPVPRRLRDDFGADLRVNTLVDDQQLDLPPLPHPLPNFETYEAVGTVQAICNGECVQGTAWNEQNWELKK